MKQEDRPNLVEFLEVASEGPHTGLATVRSHAVPKQGETVCIRGIYYEVQSRAWAVDDYADYAQRQLSVSVFLSPKEKHHETE